VLALLVAVAAAVRFLGSRSFEAPWIAPDEEIYALLGRSLWETGAFEILGASAPYYSALYPALVGLPFAVADAGDGLAAVQALQAVVMSSVAVPVYLWGRTLVSTTWALSAAALALLVPALAYSGLVMSETLFYVVTTWALWALARALEKPSVGRQAVAGLAVAAAVLTRLQAVVLLPALVVAVALLAGFTRSTVPFRRFAVAFGLVGAAAIVWVALRAVEGGSWQEVLGAYATVAEREYSLGRAAEFVAWHLADVALLTLGIPLLALLVLVVPALGGREGDPRVRAFLALAVAYVGLLAIEVGAFASRFVGHLAERQLVTAAPPLFLALALWLHRGAPRPQPAASIAALLVGAAVLLLPVRDLAVPEAAPDGFFTIPLEQLADATSAATMEATYLVGSVFMLALFVFLPRRAAPALVVLVAVGLLAASTIATAEVSDLSRRERVRVFGSGDPAWVDRSADGPVSLLWTGERYWPAVWEHLFWNRRIDEVLRMTDQPVPGPVPQRPVTPRADGTLFDASGRGGDPALLVASRSLTFAGDRLAELPATPDHDALVLWRPERPARVLTWATGILPNGDLMGLSRVQVFDCGPGRLELTLLGKEGKPFLVRLDGRDVYRRTLAPGEIARPKLAAPAGARGGTRCVYELDSAGLMGSTRVDFVRES
jgi:4-amino-4-deoxy-L-arabinose transferase-like glycosyltransferase